MTRTPPALRRFPTKSEAARAAAEELCRVLARAQDMRGVAAVVLTGGSMGEAVMAALADIVAKGAAPGPDWSRVDVWWGDERYLPAGDADRNDTQADAAGLGRLGLDPARIHRLPGPDDPATAGNLSAAAAGYAQLLARAAGDGAALPVLDALMLGVGPDGHVASLFPSHPSTQQPPPEDVTVVAVRESPKPPPLRLSLTLPALCSARQVWLLVAGSDKAEAVARSLRTTDPVDAPAGAVHGTEATVWWLDEAAAAAAPLPEA